MDDLLVPRDAVPRPVVNDQVRPASLLSTLDADTMPSPGIAIGITSYDSQHNASQGHQVASIPGSETVHFAWTMWDVIPSSAEEINRFVNYNSWDKPSGSMNQGFNGWMVSLGEFARGGFVRVDVNSDNLFQITFHQRIESDYPYSAWYNFFPIEGSALHLDRELEKNPQYPDEVEHLWPDVAISRTPGGGGTDVSHVIAEGTVDLGGGMATPSDRIWYWRYDWGAPVRAWEGPVLVDSSRNISYVIHTDGDSGKVAIAFRSSYSTDGYNEVNNVAYRESRNSGQSWLDGTGLGEAYKNFATTFDDPDGPQAFTEVSIAYDHRSYLHLIFLVQRVANVTEQMALYHWSNERGTLRPIATAHYDNPGTWSRGLNLGQISLGIGDGATLCRGGAQTNANYLYAVYTKLGGEAPEEQTDMSALGRSNGELYLSVSMDHGDNWSIPANLTNTKTPGCTSTDPEATCASEAWATIARDVSDIEILYIRDYEPDAFSSTGWTMNKVMYLNYPGGTINADYVCPILQSVFRAELTAQPACEYHARPGSMNVETLTLRNHGNIPMYGNITVTSGSDWLDVPYDPYMIPESDSLLVPVTMSAVGLTEGVYLGNVQITHDDPSQASPVDIPVTFFVSDAFYCPEDQILRTSVASPGVLSLQVGSNGRFGNPNPEGGLWRHADSSHSIFDASLVIAHGAQDPDTVVFHRFYERADPGQHGYRSLAELEIDTSAYGTGAGYAWATARMTTADSVLGVTATWFFPQHPDSGDFVIVRYTVANRRASPVADVAVGLYADLDVLAGTHVRVLQSDPKANHGYSVADWNLIYQYGYDSIGHVPYDYLYTTERYSAGVTYIAGRRYATDGLPFEGEPVPLRGRVADNRDNLAGGGPSSGLLYTTLTGLPGVTVWEPMAHADSVKDLYTALTLDQGLTLAPGQTQAYVVGLVSDTLEHYTYGPAPVKSLGASGLADVVQRAWNWAAANAFCTCPCRSDPQCDGVTNVLDVVMTVDVAFRSQPPTYDFGCGYPRTDVTCDRITDVLDVVHFVNVAFRGGDPEIQFCEECL